MKRLEISKEELESENGRIDNTMAKSTEKKTKNDPQNTTVPRELTNTDPLQVIIGINSGTPEG